MPNFSSFRWEMAEIYRFMRLFNFSGKLGRTDGPTHKVDCRSSLLSLKIFHVCVCVKFAMKKINSIHRKPFNTFIFIFKSAKVQDPDSFISHFCVLFCWNLENISLNRFGVLFYKSSLKNFIELFLVKKTFFLVFLSNGLILAG